MVQTKHLFFIKLISIVNENLIAENSLMTRTYDNFLWGLVHYIPHVFMSPRINNAQLLLAEKRCALILIYFIVMILFWKPCLLLSLVDRCHLVTMLPRIKTLQLSTVTKRKPLIYWKIKGYHDLVNFHTSTVTHIRLNIYNESLGYDFKKDLW